MSDSDLPSINEDDSPEERRQKLREATAKKSRERNENQKALLDAIQSEHGGELIETTVNIAGDITADIEVRDNGDLLDEMGRIQKNLEDAQDRQQAYKVSEAAEDTAHLLGEIFTDSDYDATYWYDVYRETGLSGLLAVFENVGDSIQSERERLSGAAEGFRNPGQD